VDYYNKHSTTEWDKKLLDDVFTNLDMAYGKYSNSAVSFTFEPIAVNLSKQVHDITFPQRQFPVKQLHKITTSTRKILLNFASAESIIMTVKNERHDNNDLGKVKVSL